MDSRRPAEQLEQMTDAEFEELLKQPETPEEKAALDALPRGVRSTCD